MQTEKGAIGDALVTAVSTLQRQGQPLTRNVGQGVGGRGATISPIEDIAVGALPLAIALVLGSGSINRSRGGVSAGGTPRQRAGEAKAPWSERMLDKGSARITFAVGAVLSFPGVSYLDALTTSSS
jgi:hypothetical protein